MGAPKRRRPVIQSRKRSEEDGEEEGGTVQDSEDDSLSEVSAGSDADDDADGEASDDSESDGPARDPAIPVASINGRHDKIDTSPTDPSGTQTSALTAVSADTEAMMNGLQISKEADAEGTNFDDAVQTNGALQIPVGPSASLQGNPMEARRREHEEYKKRRDADPAFVPNRGGFFMHDQRTGGSVQNGLRPFGRGAARGRGVPRGSFHGISYSQLSGPADKAWSHDLHDSVAGANQRESQNRGSGQDSQSRPNPQTLSQPRGPNRDFSTTSHLGDMQIRLFINGMTEPKDFTGIKRYSYTRLPFHRPPLRRDKPVRVSIPHMDVKYIFPSPDRSFIFIPRALRPNQQGFGKVKGRGSFGANYVGYGPMSSRRTSVYGGSAYSPNVLSRRSSIARELTAGPMGSPAHPVIHQPPQQQGNVIEFGKPVVRLPPAAEQIPNQTASDAPSVVSMTSGPTDQHTGLEDLPMHHPKPERLLQVSEIVAPATADFNRLIPQQQAFHQQFPMPMAPHAYPNAQAQARYPHSRHPSHPSQASAGTPLPQIPEAAIHAQPFQPFGYPAPQGFYPPQYPMYFYPSADPAANSPAAPPAFAPGQQYFYPMAVPPPAAPTQGDPSGTGGMVAQEAGGMVFYSYPSEATAGAESTPAYQPTYPAESMAPSPFYSQNPTFYQPPPPPPPPPAPMQ